MEQQQNQMRSQRLTGMRMLLVEDEYYIADDVRRALIAEGAEVIGPVSTVDAAIEALNDGGITCAVLDLNLHGISAAPIADRLVELGIPFTIATGYGSASVPVRFKKVSRCEKPFDPDALIRLMQRLSAAQAA